MWGRLGVAFVCGLVIAAGTAAAAERFFSAHGNIFAQAPAPGAPPAPQPEAPAAAAPPPTPAPVTEQKPETQKEKKEKQKAAKEPSVPAKQLFGAKAAPSHQPPEAIGYYPRGCLAGGVELPVTGPHWQVMRLSRNRNWGHPTLIRFIKNFAARVAKVTGWHGILVGDMAQPRGGPTPSGHTSHQNGLDVDVWDTPMPDHELTREEREQMSATNLVAADSKGVNPQTYTPQHLGFIKAAAEAPEVERVLTNAAVKKKLCETATGDRSWLKKVRPWYLHRTHIHIRLRCPAGAPDCKKQPEVTGDEGCKPKDFEYWFTKALIPVKPGKPAKPIMLSDLPAACKTVLNAR